MKRVRGDGHITLAIVVTADCDIANEKFGEAGLACVQLDLLADHVLGEHALSLVQGQLKKRFEKAAEWVNKRWSQKDPGNGALSEEHVQAWILASTGKTLSLVVKCVSELRKHMNDTESYRSLFLTHSQATVELITQAISSMDHEGILARSKASYLKICTLQELANEVMKYDLDGLEPLSSDGLEGRALQLETIEAEIERVQRSDWITAKSRCSDGFRKGMSSIRGTPAFKTFAREVANEIACVLEADGVRQSAQRRERYLNEPRKAWMMYLPDIEDRRVILMIYDRFRAFLKGMGVLGTDQMIADYLGLPYRQSGIDMLAILHAPPYFVFTFCIYNLRSVGAP